MGLFDKLFGKKESAPQPAAPTQATPPNAPVMVKVWDNYGRMMEIPREEWRTKVLPGNFKQHWNNADGLANLIISSLHDGFIADSLDAARQLHRIDPQPHRGATLLGVIFLQLKRFEEAERVLSDALRRHGEDGSLLTNLAKAYSGRGDEALAERTLWRGLEVDPNQDNALLWYAVLHRERGGESAETEAFRRVAALPKSWRAQLWLARRELEKKNVVAAMNWYREALRQLKPVPADALMQISGDLGNAGFLKELVEICSPHFDVKQHGLQAGNNLIKALVDLKEAPSARRILEQLYAEQRPDWREHLLFWEREIDKLDKGYGPVSENEKIEISMLTLDGPIWAREGSPFSELLPMKANDAVNIAFLCGSAEVPPTGHGDKVVSQPADPPGRVSRGLPMFLAEQVHLRTRARSTVFVPWLKRGGFVLSGVPWNMDSLASMDVKADYIVLLHLRAVQQPWQAQLNIVRKIDQKILASWERAFDPSNSAESVERITDELLHELKVQAEVKVLPTSEWLFPPGGASLPFYIGGLEQSLAVSCAGLAPDTRPFLHAERSIVEFLLDLCLREPQNVAARLLFLTTLEKESKSRPDVVREYCDRIERLQREHPLVQPAQGLAEAAVKRIISAIV